MVQRTTDALSELYETDETAWLDEMSERIGTGQLGDLDYPHLKELLEDIARSDRQKVESRLAILIMHVLKWMHQAEKRTPSWRRTITEQRQQLARLLKSGSLRKHAETVLAEIYADAVELAADETALPEETFPVQCPFTLDELLSAEVL
ncbi:MAG: DUF29 domain-containing protein [Gemmataceae bacterium]|nr:DUF29 domain-containing protein [Gemmataceae bacterium]